MCSALVPWRGLCRIFTYRTRHTQCVERLFLGVLMTDFCLKNEAYTVCSALVPSRGLCRIFAYRTRHTQCRQLAPSRGLIRIFQFKEQ